MTKYPKLPEHLDRRRKLFEGDKEAIQRLFNAGASKKSLARRFGVSRHAIRLLVDPAFKARMIKLHYAWWRKNREECLKKERVWKIESNAYLRQVNPHFKKWELERLRQRMREGKLKPKEA